MGLILAKLAEATAGGPLNKIKFELEQRMEDLAQQRRMELQQSQQDFVGEQNRLSREQSAEQFDATEARLQSLAELQGSQFDFTRSEAKADRQFRERSFKETSKQNAMQRQMMETQMAIMNEQLDDLQKQGPPVTIGANNLMQMFRGLTPEEAIAQSTQIMGDWEAQGRRWATEELVALSLFKNGVVPDNPMNFSQQRMNLMNLRETLVDQARMSAGIQPGMPVSSGQQAVFAQEIERLITGAEGQIDSFGFDDRVKFSIFPELSGEMNPGVVAGADDLAKVQDTIERIAAASNVSTAEAAGSVGFSGFGSDPFALDIKDKPPIESASIRAQQYWDSMKSRIFTSANPEDIAVQMVVDLQPGGKLRDELMTLGIEPDIIMAQIRWELAVRQSQSNAMQEIRAGSTPGIIR